MTSGLIGKMPDKEYLETHQIHIRMASTEIDLDNVLSLMKLAMAESRYSKLEFAQERMRNHLQPAFGASDTHALIVAEQVLPGGKSELLGVLYASAGALIALEGISCAAQFFYIRNEARQSRLARLLLHAFENWARKHNAFEAVVHATWGGEEQSRISQFLNYYGYENAGGSSHYMRFSQPD